MRRTIALVVVSALLLPWNEGFQRSRAQGISRTLVPAVAQRAPADIETPPPPSSQELIEAARQAGSLTGEQALL
jgi:hypothetical protein